MTALKITISMLVNTDYRPIDTLPQRRFQITQAIVTLRWVVKRVLELDFRFDCVRPRKMFDVARTYIHMQ